MPTRVLVLALVATVLSASPAVAADYNVTTSAELTSALSAAGGTAAADRVLIAAGTYSGAFTYTGSSALQIIGAGEGATIFTTASTKFTPTPSSA